MKTKISLGDVWKKYSSFMAVKNISFDVAQNEFISVIGPSGCGKTTLLYLIQGFTEKTKGTISINGKKGFVFQDHNLFPWKTIKENIIIGPVNSGKSKEEALVIAKNLLQETDLANFENYYPNQISEGMKQRVGIARALANNPEVLLMDEPFSSLDYLTRQRMHDFLLRLWKKKNLTIIFVTHDIDEAIKLSDKIIVLSKRPAEIVDIIRVDKNKADEIKEKIIYDINGVN